MTPSAARKLIERRGALLVFPIDNRPEFPSLWSGFFPRSRMRWEWDQDGDDRVARLWQLRAELAADRRVLYAKWFRGRATFFSRSAFVGIRALLPGAEGLSPLAHELLQILEMDSPLSTKELRRAADLTGRFNETRYHRALSELWDRLLILGVGEREDGSFPSLLLAATRHWQEELWDEASALGVTEAQARLARSGIDGESPFNAHLKKLIQKHRAPRSAPVQAVNSPDPH